MRLLRSLRLRSRAAATAVPVARAGFLERYGIDSDVLDFAQNVHERARRKLTHADVTFRSCPICLGQQSHPAIAGLGKDLSSSLITTVGLDAKTFADMPLIYHYCRACDHFFVSPIPALRFIDLDHSGIPADNRRENSWMLDQAYVLDKKASVAAHCKAAGFDHLDRNDPVADIGCGVGVGLEVFHEVGFRNIYGIEPDLFSVRVMQREKPWIHAVHGDAYNHPADLSGLFALVMFDNVLEHQTRPVQAAANAFAMLRPGGVFWATVPNAGGTDFRTNKMKSRNLNFGHWSYFTTTSLTKLLRFFFSSVSFYGSATEDWINVVAVKSQSPAA
jgi:SAM-dependent methyltransferase